MLIDAGPLIALFAPDDKHHRRFDGLLDTLPKDRERNELEFALQAALGVSLGGAR